VLTCLALKNPILKQPAKQILDAIIGALTTCIDTLELKKNTCEARLDDDTFKRLSDSLLDVEYMQPMKQLVIPYKYL
jgi:hypothetical protein